MNIFMLQEKSTDKQKFLQVKVNKTLVYSSTVRKSFYYTVAIDSGKQGVQLQSQSILLLY